MSSGAPLPLNWPPSLPYLAFPTSSPLLPASHRKTYCCPLPPFVPLPNPAPVVRILRITDSDHPAYGQYGLFNGGRFLPKGSWIRDYIGKVHVDGESDEDSDYDLCLERKLVGDGPEVEVVGIDATMEGNEARFVNDYRGVMEKANAVFEVRKFNLGKDRKGNDLGEGIRMAVWAGPKGIRREEEICVSYGRGFWEARRKKKITVPAPTNTSLPNFAPLPSS